MRRMVQRRSFLGLSVSAAAAVTVGCDAPPDANVTPEPSGSAATSAAPGAATSGKPARSSLPAGRTPPEPPPDDPRLAAPPDVAAPPADATKTASGLSYKNVAKGTGTEHPAEWDTVKVHYTGWTADGKKFDSSHDRNQPAEFPLNGVIAGWTEGVQLMVVGDKTRFWIPGPLAYGDTPQRGRPHGQLTFDIELLEIKPGPKPIPAPEDVAAPPKDAKKTESGMSYKVLTKGKGKAHPKADSKVQVHYTGWTTNGKMFDSSVQRNEPATFPLNRVIKGWTEGVQLMVEGEKTRFWIPAELAYGENPGGGRPGGMLCFEIELLKIL